MLSPALPSHCGAQTIDKAPPKKDNCERAWYALFGWFVSSMHFVNAQLSTRYLSKKPSSTSALHGSVENDITHLWRSGIGWTAGTGDGGGLR
jgi:hypothetical protein